MAKAPERAWIRFRHRDSEFAIPLEVVSEVAPASRPRLIPWLPLEVAGVINVKGEPLAALNAAALLDDPVRQPASYRHVLVIERGDLRVGLLVEQVNRVERDWPAAGPEGEPSPDRVFDWRRLRDHEVGLIDVDRMIERIAQLLATRHEPIPTSGEDPCHSAF